MAETKKLAEVDMVEYTDNTSLICEQDGKIRRISAGKVLGDTILSATSTNIVTGEKITISDSLEAPLAGLNIYGKSTQKTTTGAQLWDVEKAKKLESWTGKTGYKYFDIQLKSNTTYCLFVSENNMHKDYKAECNANFAFYIGETPNRIDLNTMFGNCNVDKDKVLLNKTFTTTENPFYFNLYVPGWSEENLNIVFNELLKNIMLVEGSSALSYEPYTGGVPSPSVDYPQEIQTTSDFTVEVKSSMEEDTTPQTLDITIPEQGFYGIPVSSGGNYTDTSGKQWICDEFDFKNKKFIKRTGRLSLDGSEDEQWVRNTVTEDKARFYVILSNGKIESGSKCLCNRLIYGIMGKSGSCFTSNSRFYIDVEASLNTVELLRTYLSAHTLDVIYQLETPIEIDISGEEIQAFKELHTYKPNTTIMSDSEPQAGMKVEYALDMKTYVDNKFLELATQVLENA